jgi:hypothetical protein
MEAQPAPPEFVAEAEAAGAEAPLLLEAFSSGAALRFSCGGRSCSSAPWSHDASTRKQLLRALRALRQVVAKRSANALHPFFGAASKTMSLLFLLKASKTTNVRSRQLEAASLEIPLPHPLFASCSSRERLLFLVGRGRRRGEAEGVLVIHIGWCSMSLETLMQNALAALAAVERSAAQGCCGASREAVREIRVQELDGLALPVWHHNLKLARRARPPGLRTHTAGLADRMLPPSGPPLKKAKLALDGAR